MVTHLGVPCRNKEEADRFFTTVLGLPLTRSFQVPAALSQAIFHTARAVDVLVYDDGTTRIEAFVTPEHAPSGYAHAGLQVDDLAEVINRCTQEGLECIIVPRGEKQLHFLRDSSGSLFEVTEKPRG